MPRLIVTAGAARGLQRCRQFLKPKSGGAAMRAGETIARHLAMLETSPEIGRPHPDMPNWRELVIGFGDAGYVALYRYDADDDAVYLMAFRHQREAGY